MPTTAWGGRAADSVFSVFGDDGAAFLRLAARLVRSASAWPGFSWEAAFLKGIRSGSGITKRQDHQIPLAAPSDTDIRHRREQTFSSAGIVANNQAGQNSRIPPHAVLGPRLSDMEIAEQRHRLMGGRRPAECMV
ncbi:MAG: hypothetical protein ACYC02_01415 [Thiobacillus sp.]